MIGISTQLYDVEGEFYFYAEDLLTNSLTTADVVKRLSKVRTLDGGVFIDDAGYSPGDVDLVVTVRDPSRELYLRLKRVFVYHSFVVVTSAEGNFLCVPFALKMSSGNAELLLYTHSIV